MKTVETVRRSGRSLGGRRQEAGAGGRKQEQEAGAGGIATRYLFPRDKSKS
jgi:hypothetical protein